MTLYNNRLTQRQLFSCLLCKLCLQKFMVNQNVYSDKANIKDTKMTFYSTKEAAEILHMSREVLTRKCRNGEITFKRSGRKYLFNDEDINNYISSGGAGEI